MPRPAKRLYSDALEAEVLRQWRASVPAAETARRLNLTRAPVRSILDRSRLARQRERAA